MLARIREHLDDLTQHEPGRRFETHYERLHGKRNGQGRTLRLTAALLLIIAGVILLPVPGPGSVVVLVGAALLAQESRRVAQLLDRLEIRLRALLDRALRTWRRLSLPARVLLVCAGVAVVAAGLWLAYDFFLR